MKVSAIICTQCLSRLQHVFRAVESLLTQSYKDIQVIVAVDNNARLYRILSQKFRDKALVIHNNGTPGLSATRNKGVENADGGIVVFMDDDCIAHSSWIEKLVKNYDSEEIVAVGGMARPVWENGRPYWFAPELDWVVGCAYNGYPKVSKPVNSLLGCNMSFKKDVLNKIGHFNISIGQRFDNPYLRGDERHLFTVLLNISDGRVIYDPSAIVYHHVPKERSKIRYLVVRSFYQGITRVNCAKIAREQHLSFPRIEEAYLKILFAKVIENIKKTEGLKTFPRLGAIILSFYCALMGFVVEKLVFSLKVSSGQEA